MTKDRIISLLKDTLEYAEEKDKEIERLTKQNKALNEMYELTKKEYIRLNNIINELENWLISWIENEQYCFMANNPKDRCRREIYEEVLHHFKELKGSDKE